MHRISNAIIHITAYVQDSGDPAPPSKGEKVSFTFHEMTRPFLETNRIDVTQEHFEAAQIVTDIPNEAQSDNFTLAVLFTVSPADRPCKLVKLVH